MDYDLEQFIDEAIQLELNAAEVYFLFSEIFPRDANFWATLSWEEKNHASALRACKNILMPLKQFPPEILPAVIQSVIDTNKWLDSVIESLKASSPDREKAFEIAVKIESSAGEQHFQSVVESPTDSEIIKILQELCTDDIHHLSRIREYMQSTGADDETDETEKKKVLIIADDRPLAKLLQTIMENEGQVDFALNGREGAQMIRNNEYDLVISAMEVPVVDDIGFYNEAKSTCPDLAEKLLILTGALTQERLRFCENERIRYLEKPSGIKEIMAVTLEILQAGQ